MYISQGVLRAVQVRPDAMATIFGERRQTWRQFAHRVARYAAGLLALGVERGDRVAIIAHNSDLYIETLYAISWAGAVVVPGNFRWSEQEHIHALKDCGARTLIIDADHAHLAPALSQACALEHVLLLDESGTTGGLASTGALIAEHQPIDNRSGRNHDLFAIFYTGGTTGKPKGVMLSHCNVMSTIMAAYATSPLPPDPVFLHLPPMFHLADACAVMAVTFHAGTHVVVSGFDADVVADTIEAEKISAALMVPTMFTMLRERLDRKPSDMGSMQLVRYGAAGITDTALRDAMAMFPNARFQQGFGQTETSTALTILEHRFHILDGSKNYLRSAGRPLMGTDVKIVDEQMVEKPMGEVGEIVARGAGVMLGYWNQPELTADTIIDGWIKTGDAGYIDEDGFVYIVDRVKDMIITGGENVFAAEVENALQAHAAVAQCAVFAVPDEKWGERVHAVLRLKSGAHAEPEELIAHCRALIAAYKIPRSIDITDRPFPLSAQGKIMKAEMRKPFWEGRKRMVG